MNLLYTSASQVETFETCERKWFLSKVVKLPMPTTLAQEKGIEIHAEIEDYLKTGCLPRSEVVKQALKFLPEPNPSLLLEHKIEIFTYEKGPTWVGYIDLVQPDAKPIVITDHKTTKDLRWAKTPSELWSNLQLTAYAKWAVDNYDVDEVLVRHLYLPVGKKPQAPLPVSKLLPVAQISKRWNEGLDSVREMVEMASREPSLHEVKPNWNACRMYGGCPFVKECANTKEDFMPSLSDMMKNKGTNGHVATGVIPPDAPKALAEPAAAAAAPETAPEATEEPKAKRGRPKKDVVVPEAAKDVVAHIEAKAPQSKAAPATDLMLFVDCVPIKGMPGEVTLFEEWIGNIATGLAKEKQVEDYRLLPFGTGKGELAVAVRKAPVPTGIMLISKFAPGAEEALAVLIPQASMVVRGL